MEIILKNISWITFNLMLALLPVLFILLFLRFRNKILRFIFIILWLLYLPNSLYVITDMIHIIRQWKPLHPLERLILVMQYSLLEYIGLAAFLFAVYFFEKFLKKTSWREHTATFLILLNFLIAFGMVLGRIDRINSWEAITNPQRVWESGIHVLTSPQLLLLIVLFGLFANFFYFLFRRPVTKIFLKS